MKLLEQAICRTGIFIICSQVIIHLRPKADYEKYLKLIVNAMVLLQLLLPIADIFMPAKSGGIESGFVKEYHDLEQQLSQSFAAKDTERILENMTLEEVQRKMEEQQMEEQIKEKQQKEEQQVEEQENSGYIKNQTDITEIDRINIKIGRD